jgi:phosphoglycolate phosphatase-like HAD superfamily hydrolase
MLIIFDIDGTLLEDETHDWWAFDHALQLVLGFAPTPDFVRSLPDVTAESIVEAAMRASGRQADRGLVNAVQDAYLSFLGQCYRSDPTAFSVRKGAASLLEHLSSVAGLTVAFATGDWRPTISFKLQCSGLDACRFAMATASDARCRPEIIQLAAAKAGRPLADAIYVGDGVWDLRACRELGIPFIGTGARTTQLREAGAQYICEPLEPSMFAGLLRGIGHPSLALPQGALHVVAEAAR